MKKYISKVVEKEQKVLDNIICDNCNKVIGKGLYFTVMTGHRRWGNDSIESIEHWDYCSKPCLDVAYNEYAENKSETEYFEIEVEEI